MKLDWDTYFLGLAIFVSMKSKDRSTKCGCVIVGEDHEIRSTGYNGLPRWVDDNKEERHQRPEKYYWFEHAERNAVFNAALHGVKLTECTAYITGPPCADCARSLIQAGIQRIVIPSYHNMSTRTDDQWKDHIRVANDMFREAGIMVEYKPFPAHDFQDKLLESFGIYDPKH